jgi:hypothetical protein
MNDETKTQLLEELLEGWLVDDENFKGREK